MIFYIPKKNVRIGYNNIGDDGMRYISSSLKVNKSVKVLHLWGNQLENLGAKFLADCLRENEHLLELRICSNKIRDEGAKILFQSLKCNKSLTLFDMSYNNDVGDESAQHLLEALRVNKSITVLDFCGNRVKKSLLEELKVQVEENRRCVIINRQIKKAMLVLRSRPECVVSKVPRRVLMYLLSFLDTPKFEEDDKKRKRNL